MGRWMLTEQTKAKSKDGSKKNNSKSSSIYIT